MRAGRLGSGAREALIAGDKALDKFGLLFDSAIGINGLSEGELARFYGLQRKVEKVQLVERFKQTTLGTLYVTTTHLIFVAETGGKETWILHSCLATVERGGLTAAGASLTVISKTFHALHLLIPRDRDASDLLETLQQLSRPSSLNEVYAFSYIPGLRDMEKSEGWDLFPMEIDFIRQGLPNDHWIQTDFNNSYEHCDTYPRQLWVPAAVPKQVLIGSSKFRSRGRLPVLTYFHEPTKAAISRCSQPLAGFSARCEEDERMLSYHLRANPHCATLFVVDTRPRLNAMANKVQGKGFEDEKNYQGIRFHFLDIENIHVMRNSLAKLMEGVFVADAVSRGVSCLVHCSDGWDRTAQTCALGALLLDPYYRSIEGFMALIERDWLGFGHKFSDRCAHTATATGGGTTDQDEDQKKGKKESSSGVSKEFSPVFTQWLDAVWQCSRQYPEKFEFNERFLVELHDHTHSCQYGTFLGNCDKDRADLQLPSRTYSLWAYMIRRKDHYLNPLYEGQSKEKEKGPGFLKPDLRPQSIQFWRRMYNRHEAGVHERDSLMEAGDSVFSHVSVLKDHLGQLESRLAELKAGRKFWRRMYNRHEAGVHERDSLMEAGDSVFSHVSVLKDHLGQLESRLAELKAGRKFWRRMYNRHEAGVHERDSLMEAGDSVFSHVSVLKDHLGQLESRLAELKAGRKFWRRMYNRHEAGVHERDSLMEAGDSVFSHVSVLKDHLGQLESRLAELKAGRKFWRRMYNRHEAGVHERDSLMEAGDSVFSHVSVLKDHLGQLESRLAELKAGRKFWRRMYNRHEAGVHERDSLMEAGDSVFSHVSVLKDHLGQLESRLAELKAGRKFWRRMYNRHEAGVHERDSLMEAGDSVFSHVSVLKDHLGQLESRLAELKAGRKFWRRMYNRHEAGVHERDSLMEAGDSVFSHVSVLKDHLGQLESRLAELKAGRKFWRRMYNRHEAGVHERDSLMEAGDSVFSHVSVLKDHLGQLESRLAELKAGRKFWRRMYNRHEAGVHERDSLMEAGDSVFSHVSVLKDHLGQLESRLAELKAGRKFWRRMYNRHEAGVHERDSLMEAGDSVFSHVSVLKDHLGQLESRLAELKAGRKFWRRMYNRHEAGVHERDSLMEAGDSVFSHVSVLKDHLGQLESRLAELKAGRKFWRRMYNRHEAGVHERDSLMEAGDSVFSHVSVLKDHLGQLESRLAELKAGRKFWRRMYNRHEAGVHERDSLMEAGDSVFSHVSVLKDHLGQLESRLAELKAGRKFWRRMYNRHEAGVHERDSLMEAGDSVFSHVSVLKDHLGQLESRLAELKAGRKFWRRMYNRHEAGVHERDSLMEAGDSVFSHVSVLKDHLGQLESRLAELKAGRKFWRRMYNRHEAGVHERDSLMEAGDSVFSHVSVLKDHLGQLESRLAELKAGRKFWRRMYNRHEAGVHERDSLMEAGDSVFSHVSVLKDHLGQLESRLAELKAGRKFWRRMYNRHEAGVHERDSLMEAGDSVFSHVSVLKDHLGQLESRLAELKAGRKFWRRMYNRHEAGVHERDSLMEAGDSVFSHVSVLKDHLGQLESRLAELKAGRKFWRRMYNRHEAGVHERDSLMEAGDSVFSHVSVLKDHLGQLESRLAELKAGLSKDRVMGDSGHSSCAEADASHPLPNRPTWESGESGIELRGSGALDRVGMSPSLASLDLSSIDVCSTELCSVAVRWQSLRGQPSLHCNGCGTSFGLFDLKTHCAKCGRVQCDSCLEPGPSTLPGLSAPAPLCRPCAKDLASPD